MLYAIANWLTTIEAICKLTLATRMFAISPQANYMGRTMMASSSGNDDDLIISRAAVNKMIKETLPDVRVANDARELVVNCRTELIHLIFCETNAACNMSDRKTISPEHVISTFEPWFHIIYHRGERRPAGVLANKLTKC